MLRTARWCNSKLSVCLSVTFRYRDHIGWNSSEIISWPNSLRLMRTLTPTRATWSNGNTPKLGWNKSDVRNTVKPAISPKRCKIGPKGYYDGLIGSRVAYALSIGAKISDLGWPWTAPHSCRNRLEMFCRNPPKQESCAIAKTTARCALYIGYSTIILFTPTFTTLCGFDSERI